MSLVYFIGKKMVGYGGYGCIYPGALPMHFSALIDIHLQGGAFRVPWQPPQVISLKNLSNH